jgi:Zn-dependent peptidase ImmA (M78 family)
VLNPNPSAHALNARRWDRQRFYPEKEWTDRHLSHRTDVDGVPVIVFNPLRSEPRRQSDVAHELSHLILKHDLSEIREVAGLPFRTCRSDQEEEATWLVEHCSYLARFFIRQFRAV